MKNSLLNISQRSLRVALLFLAALLITISCDEENGNVIMDDGMIEFALSVKDSNPGGRAKTLQSVLVSVTRDNGEVVLQRKKLSLFKLGEDYLSEPIALKRGSFKLTEFMVVDESNNAVYATPREGSSLEHLVNDALPANFTIAKDQTTKISPQVIMADGHAAADFGYGSFGFEIVPTFKFFTGVLTYQAASGNFELTSFTLNIRSGTEVVFSSDMPAATNEVILRDNYTAYTVEITKAGYLSYEKTFIASELKAFESTPLVVTLTEGSIGNGLIAYYPFNGNAEDVTTNNLDGIVHGATPTTDRKGKVNSAYKFDGINDYINVPHNDALNLPGDFTISLWTQISSSQEAGGGINDILRKWDGIITNGYPFAIAYLNRYAANDIKDRMVYVRFDSQFCGDTPTSYSSTITNDVFIHIVLQKHGNKLRHYLNNVLIDEFTDATDASECSVGNTVDMTIGTRGNLVRFFKGKIDDIRIYNRALTAPEISALYAE